eukprot:m.162867 g.162867  ORF g.162867 m.162867 type:complete len:63 (+) comp15210_c0_seq3:65-253(+)
MYETVCLCAFMCVFFNILVPLFQPFFPSLCQFDSTRLEGLWKYSCVSIINQPLFKPLFLSLC